MLRAEDYENSQIEIQQEIPELRKPVPAQSEHFGDFIIKYAQLSSNWKEILEDASFQAINATYGVLYVPLDQIGRLEVDTNSYNTIPKCYTYMDLESLEASGITELLNHPYLELRGRGTAVALIDSGVDYRNPVFQNSSGSRIAWFWDQSLEGGPDETVPYGKVFLKEDFDRALSGEAADIPVMTDENGHGTALGATAAGSPDLAQNFSGAAPEAQLIVVRLKPAKAYLREFYLFPPEAEVFQENDVMFGIAYAMEAARQRQLPMSLCIGLGSSQGAHIGKSPLCSYMDYVAGFAQNCISVAAGNEGTARHHFYGRISSGEGASVAELRVGEREEGFTMELWAEPPGLYQISLQSPTGETLDISSSLGVRTQELKFVFVETRVEVNYIAVERQTGNFLVYFRFLQPAAGLWKIIVRKGAGAIAAESDQTGFHIWLPVRRLISEDTYFLESSPYNTITSPGDAIDSITCTAYQYRDNSFYLEAGRGFAPDGSVLPQIAAPGVEIRVPSLTGGFSLVRGTSLAAAQTAGAAALMLEWAIVRENEPFFTGNNVMHYLRRGAKRDRGLTYPNREWGYGKLDLYHAFEFLG